MPVKLEVQITSGWKAEDNARFGPCAEIWFKDAATDKVLFRYAPCLDDKDFWVNLFLRLREYDTAVKGFRALNVPGVAGGCFNDQGQKL